MDLQGQAALVTGGGGGLGAGTAGALAKRGARVAVLDENEAAARAVAPFFLAPTVVSRTPPPD